MDAGADLSEIERQIGGETSGMKIKKGRISVNGTKLYCQVSGHGAPLIMMHGNGETHEIFDRAIPLLSERFTVYAIDSRGHGKSAPVSEYHYEDMAEDIRAFIRVMNLKSPYFYGFSDGAIIGLLLASSSPGLLSHLILSGVNLNPRGIRTGWRWLFECIYYMTKDPKMKMMLEEPNISLEELGHISIPTAVIAGGRDMVKRSHIKSIAAAIKGSRLIILPFHGHGSYIVHREKIARLILQIWRR